MLAFFRGVLAFLRESFAAPQAPPPQPGPSSDGPPTSGGPTAQVDTLGALVLTAAGVAQAAALTAPWEYRQLAEDLAPGGRIDAALLQAIATHESGNNPQAVSAPNTNGTRDYGLFQINEQNFPRYGLTLGNVFDPEANGRAAVAELQRHLPDAESLSDLISMYNAGEAPGGGPRKTAGAYINQQYVRDVLGWYLLFRVAELAPVKRTGV